MTRDSILPILENNFFQPKNTFNESEPHLAKQWPGSCGIEKGGVLGCVYPLWLQNFVYTVFLFLISFNITEILQKLVPVVV